MKGLRRKLKSSGLDLIGFDPDLRPDELAIGIHNDAFHSLRLEGDLRRERFNALYVSEPSEIPTINDHTIPDDVEFGWVDVQVSTYRRYEAIPTYLELLDRFDRYSAAISSHIKGL